MNYVETSAFTGSLLKLTDLYADLAFKDSSYVNQRHESETILSQLRVLFLWTFVLILSKKRISIQYNALKYFTITPRFTNFKLNNIRVKGFRILIYILGLWNETSLGRNPTPNSISQRVAYFVLYCLLCAEFWCRYFYFIIFNLSQRIYSHYCVQAYMYCIRSLY